MYGTSMIRFTPRGSHFGVLNTLNLNAVNRVVEDLFGELARPSEDAPQAAVRAWQPRVDILETERAYEIRAELPGVPREDVNIAVDDNVLTVSGERKLEKDVNKESYHRIERVYGSFTRSFTLPTSVDSTQVEAKLENGLLTVVVPKAAEAQPRKIEIS
jgi:HSP20 family protein